MSSTAVASLVAEIAAHNEKSMKGDKKRNFTDALAMIEEWDLADIAKLTQHLNKVKRNKSPNKDGFGLHVVKVGLLSRSLSVASPKRCER